MKKLLTSALVLGLITGLVNAALGYFLGDGILETPFEPGTQNHLPNTTFAGMAMFSSVLLTFLGALILGFLHKRSGEKGIRTWRIIAIVFLVAYGIFPFMAPEMATTNAAILVNIMHLVSGIPALLQLPTRVE
ncbi:MAG: DUF6069 family protein [Bacteroidota bacterium]